MSWRSMWRREGERMREEIAERGSAGGSSLLKKGGSHELINLASRLYDAGFNIIPVDREKRPLTKWSNKERISRDELIDNIKSGRATGIALVAGDQHKFRSVEELYILDIEDPEIVENYPTIKKLFDSSWSYFTGPRCPNCSSKAVSCEWHGACECTQCGAKFKLNEAKRGIGIAFLILNSLADTYFKEITGTRRGEKIELLKNNYQLIPPSLHPSGIRYQWKNPPKLDSPNFGLYVITQPEEAQQLREELKELGLIREIALPEVSPEKKPDEISGLKLLDDSRILELKELLKPHYRPGSRQDIWFSFSGMAAKAKVSPVSTAKVLIMLYKECGDSDRIDQRIHAFINSYLKCGIDLKPFKHELAEIFNIEPGKFEKELPGETVRGKTGLYEIFKRSSTEEEATELLNEIETLLGVPLEKREIIMTELDFEKGYYAVMNLSGLMVVRGQRKGEKLVFKEKVMNGAITELIVNEDPLSGSYLYTVRVESDALNKPLVIGPAIFEDIIKRLRAEGLIYHPILAEGVLAAVKDAIIRSGRAQIKAEITKPGFYLIEGKIVAVGVNTEYPDREELRKALELLNELAMVWFADEKEKFVEVIKWGLIAPFSYIIKAQGKRFRWLYLYGFTGTGKSTLASIVLRIWGIGAERELGGTAIDTVARLGKQLSDSTFPVVINEPAGVFQKDDVREMIKVAVESVKARGKYERGVYVDIPALSPLIFTSNYYIPSDSALMSRLKFLTFSVDKVKSEERKREFNEKVKPRLSSLSPIGQFTAAYVIENRLKFDEDYSTEILAKMYEYAGLEVPSWIYLKYEEEIDPTSEFMREIASFIIRRVNEEFEKFVGKVIAPVEEKMEYLPREKTSLEDRIKLVGSHHLLSWLILKENKVYLTRGIIAEMQGRVAGIGELESIARAFNWSYIPKKSVKIGNRMTSYSVVEADLDDFIEKIELALGA